jgi:hypothetical protein
MPRVGLPAKPANQRSARSLATLRRSVSTSSPLQSLAIGAAAIAFRLVSAFVAGVASRLIPRTAADTGETTFGIAPVIVRTFDRSFGHLLPRATTSSTVLAWLAFAAAMVMLVRLAQADVDGDRADAAALLAAVFPFGAVFGHSAADALFFAAAIAAFYGFRRQQWMAGGVCGAIATAAIPTGVLIVPALAWIGFRDSKPRVGWMVAALLLAACGFGGCLAYAYYLGGPPGGWIAAAGAWGFRPVQAPWTPLLRLFTTTLPAVELMNGVVALIALATVPLVWWRLNGGYAIYMMAMLSLPLMSVRYDSLGRTCALLFPMFVLGATIRSRVVVVLLAVTSAMFYALALIS